MNLWNIATLVYLICTWCISIYKYPLIAIRWSLNTTKSVKTMTSSRRNGFQSKECTRRGGGGGRFSSGAIFQRIIFQVQFSLGAIVLELLFRGQFSLGAIIFGGNCPGAISLRGNCPDTVFDTNVEKTCFLMLN